MNNTKDRGLKVLAIGGSSMRATLNLVFKDGFQQIFRGTTLSLVDSATLNSDYRTGHEITDKFIRENIYTRDKPNLIRKGGFDYIFIDFMRDVISHTIKCNGGYYTDPRSIRTNIDIDVRKLFSSRVDVLKHGDPDFFPIFESAVEKLFETLRRSGEGVLRKIVVLKTYPARYFFDAENGVREMGVYSEYVRDRNFLSKVYKFLEKKFPFLDFIELEEGLRFADSTSPYGPNPYHYNIYCYHDLAEKINRLIEEGGSISAISEVQFNKNMNFMKNEFSVLVSAVNNINRKLDRLQCLASDQSTKV